MSGSVGVCTIVAKNYLPFARVLMSSLKKANPEFHRFVILADDVNGYFDPGAEDFELILSEDVGIPGTQWFHFKYTILELSTAVKPYVLEHLLTRYNLSKVIYLDPDIRVYRSLDGLSRRLDSASMLLTPHLTAPLDNGRHPDDLDILRSGSYNLGFVALTGAPGMRRFLSWWQDKLYDHCVVDLPRGLFVDQRWMDMAPSLFDGVEIVREPGYNVAYWNVQHRRLEQQGGEWRVNGEPLYFFHFSGFNPQDPERFSKHQNRYELSDLPAVAELAAGYARELIEQGYAECRRWPYRYAAFDNGFPLADMGRWFQNEAPGIVDRLENPFSQEGYEAFVRVWNERLTSPKCEPSPITRFAYRIYQLRTDVQAVMPDIFGADQRRFAEWFLTSAKREHSVPDVFLAPIWDALPPVAAEPVPEVRNGTADLAEAIYRSRADVQRHFPDPAGRDAIKYLSWLLTYGKQEYRLDELTLAPVRKQWDIRMEEAAGAFARMWPAAMLGVKDALARMRAGQAPPTPLPELPKPAPAVQSRRLSIDLLRRGAGVNLAGYLRAEMGVGESGRIAARAARVASLPVELKDISQPDGPYRLEDHSAGALSENCSYAFNLFHVNADQTPIVFEPLGDFTAGRYNIGFWAWELEEFPDRWLRSFDYCQEVWTPSAFCQDAISRKSSVPVLRIPHPVEVRIESPRSRADFGLPEDRLLFLTIFDLLSVFERKNPLGVVEAFRRAFPDGAGAGLVLKVNNARHRPAEMEKLRQACAGAPVTIIDCIFSRNDVNSLIQNCDCLVSLHRSEGFGLTLGEAMYLGKPVIATAYSGNVDFTLPGNSFLVSYQLRPVGPNNEPYDAQCHWADPSIEDAARHMRTVFEAPGERARIAAAGQAFVREQLSPASVGARMKQRIEWLHNRALHIAAR